MTDYYCDLDEDTYADATGADHAGNEYTGPAGLQAAIRGTGNATALAADDTLYIKGTGDLSRLVLLDCNGTDVSAWAPTNVVRNKDGAGDDWTGVVVQANDDPAGQLGADDLVLVWLDSGKTEDDITLADGIENTTLAESADPLAAKSTPGIVVDTNSGAFGTPIRVIGQNSSWATDGTKSILDGNSKATYCLVSVGKHYWHVFNVELKNAASDNATCKTDHGYYWIFKNCASHDAGGSGWSAAGGKYFRGSSHVLCSAYNNAAYGIYSRGSIYALCTAYGNGNVGLALYGGYAIIGGLAYGNATNYMVTGGTHSISAFGVSDDPTSYGFLFSGGTHVVFGNRITGTGLAGIRGCAGDEVQDLYNFINMTTKTSNITVDQQVRGADTRIETGMEGYEDAANDLYNLVLGAAGYRTEIDMGGGNYARFARGLPSVPMTRR